MQWYSKIVNVGYHKASRYYISFSSYVSRSIYHFYWLLERAVLMPKYKVATLYNVSPRLEMFLVFFFFLIHEIGDIFISFPTKQVPKWSLKGSILYEFYFSMYQWNNINQHLLWPISQPEVLHLPQRTFIRQMLLLSHYPSSILF